MPPISSWRSGRHTTPSTPSRPHSRPKLRFAKTAQDTAFALGLLLADVVRIIQGMTREQFFKSMTSIADHRVWQDAYHVPLDDLVLYVKFTTDGEGYLVISFKEK